MLLNSVNAASKDGEVGDISRQTKKQCREARDADVMGPVDKGDRMIAKNGAKRTGSGKLSTSVHCGITVNVEIFFRAYVSHTMYVSNRPLELLKTGHEIRFSADSSGGLQVKCRTRSSQSKISGECRVSRVERMGC